MVKFLKSNQAFTLIEVLASITLLSIVGIMFLTFFSNATIFSKKTEDKLTTINLANKLLHAEINEMKKSPPGENACLNNPFKTSTFDGYSYKVNILCPDSDSLEKKLDLLPIVISILEDSGSEITTIQGYYDTKPTK